jgi:hypothetical protein
VRKDRRPHDADGSTIRDLVTEKVPNVLQLVCRTDRGMWSEARGVEITRTDLVTFTPGWLLDSATAAVDCPRTAIGEIQRPALLRAIKSELEVLWADLIGSLPVAAEATLGENTAKGRQFRSAMIRLWTATRTFEVAKTIEGTGGEAVASRASLISRVRSQAKEYLAGNVIPRPREKWRPVQNAFAAWWRPIIVPGEGSVSVLLGMRWELVGQIGIELPGVTDETSLTALGTRYGVLEKAPPVTGRLSGGQGRLGVVSLKLTEELLAEPLDEEQENQDSDSVPREGVTQ